MKKFNVAIVGVGAVGAEKIWKAEYQAKDNKGGIYYPPENTLGINAVSANDNKSIKSCPTKNLFSNTKFINQLDMFSTTI